METFFFIMALTWGSYQFIMRRTYRRRYEMLEKHFRKMNAMKMKDLKVNVPLGMINRDN